ncbi:uncharacterized protein ACA1_091100 [Acanthamoeba castellanii str. Neff]|uniref:Uncharacterized protein n=1 Tax=Acanthamoeba castellanii (strain ATCC 30010 / Neff) TaxID=1257118 RepID=L8GHT7_ACACF|nr:uncharacterized protein ACA1_091100 [Acanthamoeba castellanii str. Neff]ELR12610.1 hypothetical protein ACA1_091100 [Acanthamoeba castellanii str. Neff]
MAAEQEPVRPLKRLRYDALDSTMGDGHRRDPAHALQLTALPDLVDHACQTLVLRDHRPLRLALTVLLPPMYWDWFKAVQSATSPPECRLWLLRMRTSSGVKRTTSTTALSLSARTKSSC